MDISELLILTVEKGASDLHLTVGTPPILRINGKLVKTDYPPLTKDSIHEMIYDILRDDQKSSFEEKLDLDFAIEFRDFARFRVNIFHHRLGEGAVFRLIPRKIPTLEELGFPPIISDLTNLKKGLILVTGPTGSGKSTTLAAMINKINQERAEHIITLEDPIEFIHDHHKCVINQREIGVHATGFAEALRSALREDPDIILVGEMRDLETIALAITAAETGHLVLATLHTSGAAKTVDRIIDVFPPHQQGQVRAQVAESIEGVISQSLLARKDGCGRIAALEIMIGTSAIRNLIRENKTHQIPSIIQTGTKWGMQSLDQHLRTLLKQGLISWEEAFRYAQDKATFSQYQEEVTQEEPSATTDLKAQEIRKKTAKFSFW